jgi:hypothetical protein
MNGIIVKWNQIYIKVIILSTSTKLNTPLFTDEQVIIANSEDKLQKGIFTLQNTAKNLEIKISPVKPKMTAILGQNTVRCTITVCNKCVSYNKNFKYRCLGCETSCENGKDVKKTCKIFLNTGNSKQHF